MHATQVNNFWSSKLAQINFHWFVSSVTWINIDLFHNLSTEVAWLKDPASFSILLANLVQPSFVFEARQGTVDLLKPIFFTKFFHGRFCDHGSALFGTVDFARSTMRVSEGEDVSSDERAKFGEDGNEVFVAGADLLVG